MTVMEEVLMERLSDVGSTPTRSMDTEKEGARSKAPSFSVSISLTRVELNRRNLAFGCGLRSRRDPLAGGYLERLDSRQIHTE